MKDQLQFQGLNEPKDSYLAYYDSGKKLAKQGRFTEAIKAYEKAIELNPNYSWSYYELGIAQFAAGNFTEAIQAYEKAVELKPDHIWSYNNLGDAFSKQGKFDRAIDCYRKAMKYELIKVANTLDGHDDFMILSHTIDISYDSVEILKNYWKTTEIPASKWQFLRSTEANTKAQAKQFMTNFRPNEDRSDFYHSSFVALIDKKQQIRGFYNTSESTEIDRLIEDIKSLID